MSFMILFMEAINEEKILLTNLFLLFFYYWDVISLIQTQQQ